MSPSATRPDHHEAFVGKSARRDRSLGLRRSGRLLSVLIAILRVLTVLGAISVSGLPHAVRDVVAVVTDGELPPDDRDDCGEQSCPQGCPSCHTVHSPGYTGPAPMATTEAVPSPLAEVLPRPTTYVLPAGPSRDGLFRPPRLTAVST